MDIFVKYDSTEKVPGTDELVVDVRNAPNFDKNKVYMVSDSEATTKIGENVSDQN